jgi:hypothetical protein
MSPKEKAKAGLRLLKEAVLELVGNHPNGITPNEVREELELFSPNRNGDHKDALLWGIENMLAVERLAETRMVDGRNRIFLIGKTATQS